MNNWRGLHVLLIDDVAQLSALSELLTEEGLTTTIATTCDDALATLDVLHPDVAIIAIRRT